MSFVYRGPYHCIVEGTTESGSVIRHDVLVPAFENILRLILSLEADLNIIKISVTIFPRPEGSDPPPGHTNHTVY